MSYAYNKSATKMAATFICFLFISFLTFTGKVSAETYLTSFIDKEEVNVGDVVKVYGYVLKDDVKKDIPVSIFLNDQFIAKINSNKDGYYEAYVEITEPGINVIQVIVDNTVKKHEIIAKQPSPKPVITYSTDDYDVVIIVNDKKEVIWNVGKNADSKESTVGGEGGYVDYAISTRELDVEEGRGAKLIITINNHDNQPHVFFVNTTLDEKDYYPSKIKSIGPGASDQLILFIKPLNPETVDSSAYINIYMDGKLAKQEPLEIHIIKRKDNFVFDKVKKTEWIALGMIGIGVLLLGISLFLYKK